MPHTTTTSSSTGSTFAAGSTTGSTSSNTSSKTEFHPLAVVEMETSDHLINNNKNSSMNMKSNDTSSSSNIMNDTPLHTAPPLTHPQHSISSTYTNATTTTPTPPQQSHHNRSNPSIRTGSSHHMATTGTNSTGTSSSNSRFSSVSTTSTVPSTSTSVASLIQSAAKVSLYNHHSTPIDRENSNDSPTPSNHRKIKDGDKLFPDNEYDDFVHSLFVSSAKQQQPPHAGNLQSLQQQILPTLPDEQDRKRFLGCIAAVIVAKYQYEKEEEVIQSQKKNTTRPNEDDLNASVWEENTWSQSLYDDVHIHDQNGNIEDNRHDNDNGDYDDDDDFDYFEDMQDNSVSSSASSQQQQRRKTSTTTTTPAAVNTATSTGTTSSRLFTNRSHEATLRAQQRYRKRRYEIYGHFLIASTEHLQLEKGHGRCFLPILEQLLSVVPNNRNSTKQPPPSQGRYPKSKSLYDIDYIQYQMNDMANLRPFLEGLSPGAGIRCVAMLLVQHLLQGHGNGYDARIRHVLKSVGVLVLLHDIMLERLYDQEKVGPSSLKQYSLSTNEILFVDETDDHLNESMSNDSSRHSNHTNNININAARQEMYPADLLTLATRQFESLEQYLARKFLEISAAQEQQQRQKSTGSLSSRDIGGSARDKFFRGLKIGGTAVAAGTLFAITGGLGTGRIFVPLLLCLPFYYIWSINMKSNVI